MTGGKVPGYSKIYIKYYVLAPKSIIIRSFKTLIKRLKIKLRFFFLYIFNIHPGRKFTLLISHVADISKIKGKLLDI